MEAAEFRCWADLLPDALGIIFSNLSLQDKLTIVPKVCKSWRRAVMGPYCWQKIDIEEWSSRSIPNLIDRLLRTLIPLSDGALREISVSGLQDDLVFSFIADHARSLQMVQLPRSNMSDLIVEQVAGRLSRVTFFDLSYCSKIGAQALEAIGKNCKMLIGLRRNMHPIDFEGMLSQNDEAHAIATTMPKLKHLEMVYLCIDTESALEILKNCRELESLDVRGCWEVRLDEYKDKFPKVQILGPYVEDRFARNEWESCSDYSCSDLFYGDDDESLDGGWDEDESLDGGWDEDEERIGSLELRFYQGYDEHSGYGWPPSP